jgi:large subunit ribosomal protein L18
MSNLIKQKAELRERRKLRIRKKISGTPERPRMSVFRSAMHVYVQVIDDTTGRTLVSASSFEKGTQRQRAGKDICKNIGKLLAERCLSKNISKVAFDKNGNLYHGRVQCVAEGAREGGLQF